MQPEPTEASPIRSSTAPTEELPSTPSQHGRQHSDEPASRLLHGGDDGESSQVVVLHGDDDGAQPASYTAGRDRQESRVKEEGSPPTRGSPINRIDEHERAMFGTPQKSNSPPGFKVVQNKRLNEDGVSLPDLPNGRRLSHLWFEGCVKTWLINAQRFSPTFCLTCRLNRSL